MAVNINSDEEVIDINQNNIDILSDRVISIITKTIKFDKKILLGNSFYDDLCVDSLDFVEIIMAIEAAFSIVIPTDEVEKLYKVEDLVGLVISKVKRLD